MLEKILIAWIIGAILITIISTIVIILQEIDPPDDDEVMFVLVFAVILWPLTIVSFIVGCIFIGGRFLFRKRNFVRRKLKAKYWEYKAKKYGEEDTFVRPPQEEE